MRPAYSLIELLVVLVLVGLLSSLALPRLGGMVDRAAVRGAVAELTAILAGARQVALLRSSVTDVVFDSAAGTVTVAADGDSLLSRTFAELGVRLVATQAPVRYGPSGRGYGVSNATVVLTRGTVAETVMVSRLGRVRVLR